MTWRHDKVLNDARLLACLTAFLEGKQHGPCVVVWVEYISTGVVVYTYAAPCATMKRMNAPAGKQFVLASGTRQQWRKAMGSGEWHVRSGVTHQLAQLDAMAAKLLAEEAGRTPPPPEPKAIKGARSVREFMRKRNG